MALHVRLTILIVALTLSLGACIKHGRNRPQTGDLPVYSLPLSQTLALAAMVSSLPDVLPDNRAVGCMSFIKLERGHEYSYSPDASLLRSIHSRREIVDERKCPPTYWGEVVLDPARRRIPPSGYVDPYRVELRNLQFTRTSASAEISLRIRNAVYLDWCVARRISRNNWQGICRGVSGIILS